MSGIVGSYYNIRGSGIVAKLGTDGQVFTSAGAGVKQTFEAAAGGGSWNHIKTLTSDGSDATLSFVDGADDVTFDNTYKIYRFHYQSIHPETNATVFEFQASDDGGSSYAVAVVSSFHRTHNNESGYNQGTGSDTVSAGGSTDYSHLMNNSGSDADQTCNGWLTIQDPSNTTFMKCWAHEGYSCAANDYWNGVYGGGYWITTSAIDAIQFRFSSGEIQAGTISLYGLTT